MAKIWVEGSVKVKRVRIRNFRSIRDAEIELGDSTVLIGPNNAGKTAILEAIRIVLTRRWGQRGTGFTEYDVHLHAGRIDPKVGEPVIIEIELQEAQAGDWPEAIQETLADIIQLNPQSGAASILLKVSCQWDAFEESYVPQWQFLNVDRNTLTGKGARSVNFQEFFSFIPVFYLSALRDASDEFSVKSQFWGKLLKSVQIPEALEKKSLRIFDLLNAKLLAADPKLGQLATSLSDISRVANTDAPGEANLRMLPLNTWELLSKAEVIYQTDATKPWLPLTRHGQGVQSLSVMFLFRSFVELVLEELFNPESEPILAMEEPETHLHPQASRTLFGHIDALDGQKIVSTHSPYFLQHVPFRDIRVVRASPDGTRVLSLPRKFSCSAPKPDALDQVIANSGGLLSYDNALSELIVHGELAQQPYQTLLTTYATYGQWPEFQVELRRLRDASLEFVPDEELEKLETFARRIRGEIFFATRWLLVEGQSEYHLLHGIAKGMGYDLDEFGVSVIDFQNNGNPECFAALGRALGYPWVMVVDGDDEGNRFLADVKSRNFSNEFMAEHSRQLPDGAVEAQLVASGLQTELKEILQLQGDANSVGYNDEELIQALKRDKRGYAALLGTRCAVDPSLTARMPAELREAIDLIKDIP